jgi:hypothetical protein
VAIAAVQRASNAAVGSTTGSVGAGQGWVTPTVGNLLIATWNLDVTMTTPSGWMAGPSIVDDNAPYMFWKISDGTESTVSATFASTNPVTTACEYSGASTTPFDVQNSSTVTNTPGSSTTSTGVTTTAAGDLVFAMAGLADFNAAFQAAPTAPSWTNSFVNVLSQNVGPSTAKHLNTYIGELVVGAAGAYSTACSWSTASMEDRHLLVIAFKAAATCCRAGRPAGGRVAGRQPQLHLLRSEERPCPTPSSPTTGRRRRRPR